MTTKTDMNAATELDRKYKPAVQGLVSPGEDAMIQEVLELKTRTDIELQNVRDAVVMFYGQRVTKADTPGQTVRIMKNLSCITGVIDGEKARRGLSV